MSLSVHILHVYKSVAFVNGLSVSAYMFCCAGVGHRRLYRTSVHEGSF